MELLELNGAQAVCTYQHPEWDGIPAVTLNRYGEGQAAYLGCYFEPESLDALLAYLLPEMEIPVPELHFLLIRRSGVNQLGRSVDFFFNYSGQTRETLWTGRSAVSLLSGRTIGSNAKLTLPAWGLEILEVGPSAAQKKSRKDFAGDGVQYQGRMPVFKSWLAKEV